MTTYHITRREKIRFLLREIDESIDIIRDNLPDSGDPGDFMRLGIVKDGLYKRFEYKTHEHF
ncbi:MAG: hypothetical protein JXA44_01450 [Methanospirillaceae archaeon]|nr:hypothetical protein [Methanospirillaceae archaeon]